MIESVIQIKSGITINVDGTAKNITHVKMIVQNPATCSCKNSKYIASITDSSVTTCDEIIDSEQSKTLAMKAKSYKEETKTVTKNFNETNAICKMENFYNLFAFL